jgi:hypothetical protein
MKHLAYTAGLVLALFLVSCAHSPNIAYNDAEGIKGRYEDPKLASLNNKYQSSLQDIFARYRQSGIDIYKEGIGFTKLSDRDGQTYYYLMVFVKPSEIAFDGATTTPEQRLATILNRHFGPNLRYLKLHDLQKDEIDGVAFGVYWAVRDFNECSKYGGFLEYAVAYLKKADVISFLDKTASFSEIAKDTEIVTSQGLKDPVPIRLVD